MRYADQSQESTTARPVTGAVRPLRFPQGDAASHRRRGRKHGEHASAPYRRLHPPSAMIAPTRPVPSATMMNPVFQLP